MGLYDSLEFLISKSSPGKNVYWYIVNTNQLHSLSGAWNIIVNNWITNVNSFHHVRLVNNFFFKWKLFLISHDWMIRPSHRSRQRTAQFCWGFIYYLHIMLKTHYVISSLISFLVIRRQRLLRIYVLVR